MSEPSDENLKVTMLLGAGSSVPANYPTTEEFFRRYGEEIQPHHQDSFSIFKNIQGVRTIDDFIRELRDVIAENSPGYAIPEFLKSMHKNYENINNSASESASSNLLEFRNHCESMYELAIQSIYDYYSWNNNLEGGYDELCMYIDILKEYNSGHVPVFTTNYDVAVESMTEFGFEINSLFEEKRPLNREYWEGRGAYKHGSDIINLFKLHGSIDWNYINGELVKSATTHPYHSAPDRDRRELVPPGLTMGSRRTEEPYGTYFDYYETYLSTTDVLLVIGHALNDEEIVSYIDAADPYVINLNPNFNTENTPHVEYETTISHKMEADQSLDLVKESINEALDEISNV